MIDFYVTLALEALTPIEGRRAIRYIGGVPGQCGGPWSKYYDALVTAGLLEEQDPTARRKTDRYGPTPAGELALKFIGDRG